MDFLIIYSVCEGLKQNNCQVTLSNSVLDAIVRRLPWETHGDCEFIVNSPVNGPEWINIIFGRGNFYQFTPSNFAILLMSCSLT